MHPSSAKSMRIRTKVFAKDHALKSWWCILSTTFLLFFTVLGTFPNLPGAWRTASCILTAFLTVRLFVIYHDQQHRAILPQSRSAEFCMRLFGLLALCPSSVWRASHDHHHAHNSKLMGAHIGSYPVMTKEQYRRSSRAERFRYLFVRHPLTIVFGYLFSFLLGMVVLPLIRSPRKHYDCLLALILHLAIISTLVMVFGWLAALLTLILPMLMSSAIGAYLFYAQHNFPDVTFKDKSGWTYEGAAMESTSYLKTNVLMAWFTGNIGYHHIHHLNHRIPFYRLPEVYRTMPELQNVKTTSLHPWEILRCLRLKVWCVESQRMVGVHGL